MLEAIGRINLYAWWPDSAPCSRNYWRKDVSEMADILNLALPYFGLIFIGFACGKTKGLPESGLA